MNDTQLQDLEYLNKNLATKLGWNAIIWNLDNTCWTGINPKTTTIMPIPAWTKDSGLVFDLMVELSCYPMEMDEFIRVNNPGHKPLPIVDSDIYIDKKLAVRVAIIIAAIEKLSEKEVFS